MIDKPNPVGVSISQGYRQGQVLFAVQARIKSCQTKPPSPYTEDVLIEDMMAAHKFARTDAERVILRTVAGIGTSRTRESIVKGLLAKGYLESARKGKLHQLRVTSHGMEFIGKLPGSLKSVSMTALWEKALGQIVLGEVEPAQLRVAIRAQVSRLIAETMQTSASVETPALAPPGQSKPEPDSSPSREVPKRPFALFGAKAARRGSS